MDRRHNTDIKATFLSLRNDGRERKFITGTIEVQKDPTGKFEEGETVNLFLSVDPTRIPEEGGFYSFRGRHEEFNGKLQFKAQEYSASQPVGRDAICKYLLQYGRGAGIGIKTAEKIFDMFGPDCLDEIEKDHLKLCKNFRVSEPDAKYISQKLADNKKQREVEIKLFDLLSGRKFPSGTVSKCMETFGLRSAELVQKNPFLLLRFGGVGIKLCDKLWIDLGHDPKSWKRMAHTGRHELSNSRDGSTWHEPRRMKSGMPACPSEIKMKAIGLSCQAKLIAKYRDSGEQWWLCDYIRGENEWLCAKDIAERSIPSNRWDELKPLLKETDLSIHQYEKIAEGFKNELAVLIGAPGVGKSYVAARIVEAWRRKFGGKVLALAPTGKAAVRLTESFESNNVPITARTIHSALAELKVDVQPYGEVRSKWTHDLIIIDEVSMLNTDLFRLVLQAASFGTHIILIGDQNQLPPIEHGAPLRDLIKSGIPIAEVSEIRRNSGNIVKSCHQIKDGGEIISTVGMNLEKGENLLQMQCSDIEATDRCERIINKLHDQYEADPVWDCQIIVATNNRRTELNKHFQQILNGSPPVEKSIFRVGDKVINLSNEMYPDAFKHQGVGYWEEGSQKIYVANGEIGRVVHSEEGFFIADIPGKGKLYIARAKKEDEPGCYFDLAYAITVHKAQGSQAPFIITVIDSKEGKRIYSREWLYTAISRAEKACFIVGDTLSAKRMLKTVRLNERKTFLAERIQSRLKIAELPEQQQTLEIRNEFGKVLCQ